MTSLNSSPVRKGPQIRAEVRARRSRSTGLHDDARALIVPCCARVTRHMDDASSGPRRRRRRRRVESIDFAQLPRASAENRKRASARAPCVSSQERSASNVTLAAGTHHFRVAHTRTLAFRRTVGVRYACAQRICRVVGHLGARELRASPKRVCCRRLRAHTYIACATRRGARRRRLTSTAEITASICFSRSLAASQAERSDARMSSTSSWLHCSSGGNGGGGSSRSYRRDAKLRRLPEQTTKQTTKQRRRLDAQSEQQQQQQPS